MVSWNISTSIPLPTSNRCAHARPKMSAKVVVVTQHIRVIFQVRLSCPPACKLDTPTTIELKISGTNSILSKPIKILLTIPIPYKLTSKNEVCGNTVSRNPNSTPNTAAIKICVFKLIFSCIFNIDLKPHYAMQCL
ncbi:MAG: hypothetical protein ACD_6C00102G0003 [uncultured bacterium]|nr:MAG: hypothetical protein ACD_6C00102G0003 [uncultured bacterium]